MDKKIWKVRIKKAYADATNHIVVGEVLEITPLYIRMKCKAYHFKKLVQAATSSNGIFVSDAKVRIFPWHVISYITELPEGFNWKDATVKIAERGDIILNENETKISIKGGAGWVEY
ncbi:MAG: hypothetical protein WC081_03935 [Candidatus Ratteibacteria bacterium]|jgi:hypothetical protein